MSYRFINATHEINSKYTNADGLRRAGLLSKKTGERERQEKKRIRGEKEGAERGQKTEERK